MKMKGDFKMSFSIDTFKKDIGKVINKHQIPGVGVGFNIKGERFYDEGFGYRHVEEKLPITPDTVFGIASMTKSFTCVAIMKLQEEGKLSVHDQVIKYLPEFNLPNKDYLDRVTIHHLMTHTAGLPPLSTHKFARKRSVDQDPSAKDYGLDLLNNDGEPIDTYEQFIDYISTLDITLLGPPGTQFSYSNDSYGLLGVIIARASGQSYESYIEEKILKPANMVNSFFDLDELDTRNNVTTLYASKKEDGNQKVYAAPVWWDAPSMRAGGYLKSTVNDILNYLEIIRIDGVVSSNRILTTESVRQLTYPHVEIEQGYFYGYGFSITPDYFGSTLIEHGGGLKGVSSFMGVIPEKDLTGVVLTNLSGVPAETMLLGAVNLAHDQDFLAKPIQYEKQHITTEQLETYTGTFTSHEGMNVAFTLTDDQLVLDTQDSANVPLSYVGDDTFVTPENKTIRFIKNEAGEIIRVFYGLRQIFKDK